MEKINLEDRAELIGILSTLVESVLDNESYVCGLVAPPLQAYRQIREEVIKLPDACEILEKLAAGMEKLQGEIESRYRQIDNGIDYANEDYSISMASTEDYLRHVLLDAKILLDKSGEYEEYLPTIGKKDKDKKIELNNLKIESVCERREAHSISQEPHFHPAVHLYVCRDDEFMVIKKNKSKNFQGYLDIPGGHVSTMLPAKAKYPFLNHYFGEQFIDTDVSLDFMLYQTAQREMKEETGVDVHGVFGGTRPLEPFVDFFIHKEIQNFEFVAPYLIKWSDSDPLPKCSDNEISDYYWVKKNKIPDLIDIFGKKAAPALQNFNRKILDGKI